MCIDSSVHDTVRVYMQPQQFVIFSSDSLVTWYVDAGHYTCKLARKTYQFMLLPVNATAVNISDCSYH